MVYGDNISRQAALDALRTCYDTETVTMDNGDEYINYNDAVGEIEQLPPAQPEIIRCKDCKHFDPIYTGGEGVCGHWNAKTEDNAYCSYAERRGAE